MNKISWELYEAIWNITFRSGNNSYYPKNGTLTFTDIYWIATFTFLLSQKSKMKRKYKEILSGTFKFSSVLVAERHYLQRPIPFSHKGHTFDIKTHAWSWLKLLQFKK